MFLRIIKNWYIKRYKNNEPLVVISLILSFCLIFISLGKYISPILASLIIAYLLDTFINILYKTIRLNRIILISFVYIIFLIILLSLIFILFPVILHQMFELARQSSNTLSSLKTSLEYASKEYPSLLTLDRINLIVNWFNSIDLRNIISNIGSFILQSTATTLPILFSILIYLFVVPLMVLYFLKDKESIIKWFIQFLPKKNNALFYFWYDF